MSKTNVVVNDAPGALYDTDVVEWTQVMAERLRQRDSATLDWENIAEEVESLGRRIGEQRDRVHRNLTDSPSLRRELHRSVQSEHPRAARKALPD